MIGQIQIKEYILVNWDQNSSSKNQMSRNWLKKYTKEKGCISSEKKYIEAMVRSSYGIMVMDRQYEGGNSGWFAILITSILLRGCYLQYTNFLSLTDKELVIVRGVIPVHASEKQWEIKTAPSLIWLPGSLDPWRSLNWLTGWNRGWDCWCEWYRLLYKWLGLAVGLRKENGSGDEIL